MNASERTVREAIERAVRAGMRVRAILPVDLFGRCAPVEALRRLATREGMSLVVDAAQAIAARDERGRPSGAAGDAGCFSFFPTKNLGAWGDGGAIVTDRDDLAARARRLRAHGALQPYVHGELGRNSRLDALQAAVLLAKAPRLPAWQDTRARIARRYRDGLRGLPLTLPTAPEPPAVHAWHAFVVRSGRRDGLAAALRERGVEGRVYYPVPLHRQPCFASLGEPALPVTEDICRTALALPISPALRDEQQRHVIEQTAAFFRE
jgi:dTDP-4-amino-4,6-dideoxygalactose transaminase